jgi:hypothetical protein
MLRQEAEDCITERHVIPAVPGYFVLIDLFVADGRLTFSKLPVIGWAAEISIDKEREFDGVDTYAVPITPAFIYVFTRYAIMDPNGSVLCFEAGGGPGCNEIFKNFAEFEQAVLAGAYPDEIRGERP